VRARLCGYDARVQRLTGLLGRLTLGVVLTLVATLAPRRSGF
jgi:hypothetical protein